MGTGSSLRLKRQTNVAQSSAYVGNDRSPIGGPCVLVLTNDDDSPPRTVHCTKLQRYKAGIRSMSSRVTAVHVTVSGCCRIEFTDSCFYRGFYTTDCAVCASSAPNLPRLLSAVVILCTYYASYRHRISNSSGAYFHLMLLNALMALTHTSWLLFSGIDWVPLRSHQRFIAVACQPALSCLSSSSCGVPEGLILGFLSLAPV